MNVQEKIKETEMRTLEARIANLSPAKRALLEQHLLAQKRDQHKEQVLSRRAVSGSAPLSYAQQRLWFLAQLDPHSTAYNNTRAYKVSGNLNLPALQQSIDAIIRRHESLRTTFVIQAGEPIQLIQPAQSLPITLVDLRHLSTAEQTAEGRRWATAENQRPFDLTQELMRRVILLRLAEDEHLLLLTSHHIASDGWSTGVFWRELSALYAAFTQGQPSPLPELPVQYADYASWQRQLLQGERLATLLCYWQEQLAGAPGLLNLPLDFSRPAQQNSAGAVWRFSLPPSLTNALKTLARQNEATLFMTLLAAFQVLLSRYANQTDIVVGTPIAGRQHPELEGLIGMFVNTLVMRADLSGNPSFRSLLQQVRNRALGAYAHQELPFERLVETLQPMRSLSHHPIFQVMFVHQNTPKSPFELLDLQVERLPVAGETAKFDLSLSVTETSTRFDGQLEYDTALFLPSTIERMAGHYTRLLESIITNPDCPIEQLPLLTNAERHQLLVEWNNTATEYPREQCIHQLFEEQVERTPEAVALIFGEEQLTYRQLNARANQLAHYLIQLGVGPEVLVGIYVERSLEMIIGILAILKAGGAYVPIDPLLPQERISFMLQDAQIKVLLTEQRWLSALPLPKPLVVCLDLPPTAIADQNQENPVSLGQPSNLAYVIYTSGSSGLPKGAMITHQNLSNHFHWRHLAGMICAEDRIIQNTTISFDAAALEIFPPLLTGASVVIAQPGTFQDIDYMIKTIIKEQITLLDLPPSLLPLFLAAPQFSYCTSLRQVRFGGEAITVELKEKFLAQTGIDLFNGYGPTETTIAVLYHRCQPAKPLYTVPIGKPIANTQIYILDDHLNPVPVGIAGNLYIGGDCVGRGYLNRPELTQQNFIPNPFAKGQLYKSGDLACYLSNGDIQFLGRKDNQVKIRGFRVELGEIEAALNSHPAVREVVVVARENERGDKQLVAYVVSSATQKVLRAYLDSKLPNYMLPSAYVQLDALPLMPNGKVDRLALAARPIEIVSEQPYAPPVTPVENQIADIWCGVLGRQQVGLYDNFFAIGGHSLRATQVISRLRDGLRVEVPLRTLFEEPTLLGFAKRVETFLWVQQDISTNLNQADQESGLL